MAAASASASAGTAAAVDDAAAGLADMALEGETTLRTRHAKADMVAMDTERNQVTIRGPVDYTSMGNEMCNGKPIGERGWEDLLKGDYGSKLLEALRTDLKWPTPFPVQQACLPLAKLVLGRAAADGTRPGILTPHIFAQAENGAGKTGAFCLAALMKVGASPSRKPRAIIVTPSTELAVQAAKTMSVLTSRLPEAQRPVVRAFLKTGRGAAPVRDPTKTEQLDVYRASELAGADVITFTYGKLGHALRDGLDLSDLRCVILDEADELLDVSDFRTSLASILDKTREGGRPGAMVMAFSATFDSLAIKPATHPNSFGMARKVLGDAPGAFATVGGVSGTFVTAPAETWHTRRAPAFVNVTALTIPTMTHLIWEVPVAAGESAHDAKLRALRAVMQGGMAEELYTLVFCNTTKELPEVADACRKTDKAVHMISGGLPAGDRKKFISNYAQGYSSRTLVATNAIAKGVDIPALQLVIHFGAPMGRSGGRGGGKARSGRGGRGGRGRGAAGAAAAGASLDTVTFIHRSGRVARAGRTGVVLSMVTPAEAAVVRALFESASSEYVYTAFDFEPLLAAAAAAAPGKPVGEVCRHVVDGLLAAPRGADRKPEHTQASVTAEAIARVKADAEFA